MYYKYNKIRLMKDLKLIIKEKLILNKTIKHINSIKISKDNYKEVVNYIKSKAIDKGLKVVFRNKKLDSGDFCFFIYNKKKQDRYLVGYDGYWDENSIVSFEHCAEQTIKYIEDYK